MEEYDTLEVIKILEAASELSLQELISRLQSFLIENKTNWAGGTKFRFDVSNELQARFSFGTSKILYRHGF